MFCNWFGAGGNGFGGSYGGPNFFMMIPMMIILLMVVYLIFKAINNKNLNYATNNTNTSLSKAMIILDERFAKGEINEEEYLAKKNQLQK